MKTSRSSFDWGELIIPAIAVLYAAASLADQVLKQVEWKTLMYSVLIGAGVFITAAICVIQAVLSSKGKEAKKCLDRKAIRTILLFLFLSAGFIVALDLVGYVITVPVFLAVMLSWMKVRPWWKIALVAAVMLAVVHFLFVVWAEMPLPVGLIFEDPS